MKHIATLLFCLLTTACGTISLERSSAFSGPPSLESSGSMYVILCANGTYEDKNYTRSGQMTAEAVASAFRRHLAKVETGSVVENQSTGLSSAKAGEYTYLVSPSILHWEDRATEWSGKPDRLEVKLVLLDVLQGTVVDTVTVRGSSKWFTFGGDHPQDMLERPINKWADTMF